MKNKKSINDLSQLANLISVEKPDFVLEEVKEEQKEVEMTDEPQVTKQDLRIELDRKLKGGKKATRIYNFVGSEEELERLAKLLKNKCACGGGVKEGEIILQGDFVSKVKPELEKLGYKYKTVGGGFK